MIRSKNAANGVALPYSGVIIGTVVKALGLDHGVLKGRTARRLFSGKPVSDQSRAEIFKALGKATIRLGIVSEPAFLERYQTSMSSIVGDAFSETAMRWDSLLALMQSHSPPVRNPAVAINGFLRLVVVDLALRAFAFARLSDLDPPASLTPVWAEENSQRELLRGLTKDAGLTREQLADRLGVTDRSVDNWLDGKVKPTRRNVAALADALSHDMPDSYTRRMERAIERRIVLAHLADLLVPWIGRKRVLDLGIAFHRLVRRITADVEGMNRPALDENPTAEVIALIYGTAHPSTIPLVEDLASVETDQGWKNIILAAAFSWEAAFQRIAIESGLPRTAAGLAQDVSDLPGDVSDRPRDPNVAADPDPGEEIRGRLTRQASTDNTIDLIHGGIRALTRSWESGIALRRNLVSDFPTNPEAHFNLGSYLGKVGELTRRRDLVDEGIRECKIAALLSPEWDAPAVEPAIILANFGAYEESLQELNWAKSVLPEPTPHLQYGFGYTLMMLDRYDEALSHLKEVIESKPDYALALRDAARCSFKLRDHKNGARYAKLARRFGDPVEYDLWRSGAYAKRKTRG